MHLFCLGAAGQRNDYFGFRAISIWLISSLYQTFVVFFFVVYGCSPLTSDRAGGQPYSMWQTGVVLFSVIIITVHLQVVQVMEQWTWLHHLAIWLSQRKRCAGLCGMEAA